MFVFEMNGSFDALLDMDLASAEIYVMRRFVACGEEPCYRWVYTNNNGKLPLYVEYGTKCYGKYSKSSYLKEISPVVSLKGEWEEETKNRQKDLSEWQEFFAKANACNENYYELRGEDEI